MSEILVVTSPSVPAGSEGEKGIFGGVTGPVKLDVDVLQKNITTFFESVNRMLAGIPKVAGPYNLDEIELKIEVNAEGSIQLIGGVKAGATGGITFRMKK